MMDVQDLRMVSAVDSLGTLTRAAASLHVTQSALSHRLSNLEDRLGTPLFERRGRLLRPTPAGLRLASEAGALLSGLQRAVDAAQAEGKTRPAVLRLATECYTCYGWLLSIFRSFSHDAPGVEIEIVLAATRRPLPALLSGDLDIAIINTPVRDRRLKLTPVFHDELLAIVAKDHPWANRRFVRAEDFATERLYAYTAARDDNTLLRQLLIPAGVTPAGISEIPLTEALIEMAAAGLGVAVVAQWAAASAIRRSQVSAVQIGPRGLHVEWHAATLRSAVSIPHIRTFIRALARL